MSRGLIPERRKDHVLKRVPGPVPPKRCQQGPDIDGGNASVCIRLIRGDTLPVPAGMAAPAVLARFTDGIGGYAAARMVAGNLRHVATNTSLSPC